MKESYLSTKIFSFITFVLCCIGLYLCKDLVAPLSYEPLGPRAFPLGSLVLIAFCCILLFFFAEKTKVHWGSAKLWVKNIMLAISFIIFIVLFENLGFIISTVIFAFLCGLVFDGRVKFVLPFSIFLGVFLYYCFDRWFDVTLPLGYVFT